jgi:hypothetical protein
MISKVLKKKLELKEDNTLFYSKPFELEYYLLESDSDYQGKDANEKIYGVGVLKKTSGECCEEDMVLNCFSSIEETNKLVNKLVENTVTPVGLKSVVEDLLKI